MPVLEVEGAHQRLNTAVGAISYFTLQVTELTESQLPGVSLPLVRIEHSNAAGNLMHIWAGRVIGVAPLIPDTSSPDSTLWWVRLVSEPLPPPPPPSPPEPPPPSPPEPPPSPPGPSGIVRTPVALIPGSTGDVFTITVVFGSVAPGRIVTCVEFRDNASNFYYS